jgi:hypothetical protein
MAVCRCQLGNEVAKAFQHRKIKPVAGCP